MEKILNEEYKKEADGRSYLLLNKTKNTYEEQMIREAAPTGVLPMAKSEREEYYKYDITGRKTLSMTFERVPMNEEQVQKVLQGILAVLERAREYLLSEEHFLLQPDYIFLRIPEYEVTLCYYPEYSASFSEQMGKLFEMLLNRVDYREEKAISLVYALYMQLQEPDMTLVRMKEKLGEQIQGEVKVRETAEIKPSEREGAAAGVEERNEKKPSLLERFREDFNSKLSLRISEKKPQPTSVKKPFSFSAKKRPEADMTPAVPPAYIMESLPEWGTQHTRVVSVKKEGRELMLVSEKTGERIRLAKFPFYIGSLAGYVDYVMKNDTVSRFHAKFVKENGEVFLIDLNSTNGTKVNGHSLNVQEKVRLLPGDCIFFADEKYRFLAEDEETDSLFYR
ncbi:MAG: FHA domain-containing protein [Lachnospiraceae bacterium]|nr:FHA domain-containing protein [Lachnospiraceae bacterium]